MSDYKYADGWVQEVWTAILEQLATNEKVPEMALEKLIKMTKEV